MSWVFIFRANLTKSICAARCWGDMKRCRCCVSGFLGSSSSLPVPSCRTPHKHLKRTVWRWNKTGHLTPLITSPSITQRHWSWAQDSIMASSPLPCRKSHISITITIILFLFFMLLQKLEEKAASLRWKTRRWVTSSGTSVQIKANSDKTKTEILPAHRKSRSDNMNQSSWKLPDFFFFSRSESETDRGTAVDGGRMRGKREEGRRKASHRDAQMDWQGEREVEMDREKRSSFPCSLCTSGSKGIGKKKSSSFSQALGVMGPQGPAANGCFSWGLASRPRALTLRMLFIPGGEISQQPQPHPHRSRVGITSEQRKSTVRQQAFGFD